MAYDEMGNYTGYDEPVSPYDFEEEDRRKEELKRQLEEQQRQADELASQVSHKQEVTTYGDGSRTVKSTQEIPSGGKVQPVVPTNYNASIAQQESGNNPNIGFHNQQLSSAYGPYGTTAAGWEDARKLNPNLPQDITQATPEQLTAGQDAYTQQNAKYLQAYGIEPNANTLSAAHVLGAKGLSDYQTKKDELGRPYLSPQAQRANGGYDKLAAIVNGRLGGQAAPASGAAEQQPQQQPRPQMGPVSPEQAEQQGQQLQQQLQSYAQPAQPEGPTPNSFDEFGTPIYSERQAQLDKHVDDYTNAQNNPQALMNFNSPYEWLNDRAKNRAADLITQQRDMQAAQEKLATATPTDLAKYLREKTTGGSWLKAIFYAAIGAKQLAQEEGAKLGIGTEKIVMGPDGKANIVKVSSNGTPLEGYSAATGKKLTEDELVNAVAGAQASKWQTSAEFFQDKAGNVYQSQHNDKGQVRTVNTKTGAVYNGDEKLERLRDNSKIAQMAQAQEYRRENINSEVMAAIQKKRGQDVMGALADYEAQSSTPLNDEQRMAFIKQYGGLAVPGTSGKATPTGATAAPAPAPQGAVAAPVAPEVQANAPVVPGTTAAPQANAPSSPTAGPVKPGYDSTGMPVRLPTEGGKAFEKRYNDWNEQQKLERQGASQVSVDEQKRFSEYVEKDLQPKADAGKMISRVRKEQLYGPDGLLNNKNAAALAGLLEGGQGSQVGDIIRDLTTGAISNQADLSKRVASLNLNDEQRRILYQQAGLNSQILPMTLKANAGPGAISEAEHKINREANVDITRQPLHSALTLMTRDQFVKDMAAAKNDFRSQHPEIKTTAAMNNAWDAQERKAQQAYDGIYAARAAYIAKYNPLDNNGKQTNPGAVIDAFKTFPVPVWTGKDWDYGTEYAKKAARAPLSSFNR